MTDEYIFDFNEQLKMSHGIALTLDFRGILLTEIPNAIDVLKADYDEDRTGTDWWVHRLNNRPLSIDLKARSKDFGFNDLALETWSVVERKKVGWTRDETKGTDFVLWFWGDTKRWCLLPFPMLCRVFILEWESWQKIYKTAKQRTDSLQGSYHSECVFVPRKVVWEAIITNYRQGVTNA